MTSPNARPTAAAALLSEQHAFRDCRRQSRAHAAAARLRMLDGQTRAGERVVAQTPAAPGSQRPAAPASARPTRRLLQGLTSSRTAQ